MSKEIGYFGEEGSFAHLAANRRFSDKKEWSLHPCPKLGAAFTLLSKGTFKAIVVPIENASRGTITETVDQLIVSNGLSTEKCLVRECLAMRIKLFLLASELGITPEVIYSHSAALTHADAWLDENFPWTKLQPVESTSAAAQMAAKNPNSAALAGEQLIELYGLKILRDDVQETIPNRTKFYVITSPEVELPSSELATHTALIFEAAHRPGSLVAALKVLSDLGLNLTMIQSRPIPGRFDEYRFFIEFEGVPGTEKGDAALAGLKAATHSLNLLGSYPIVNLS